MKRQYFSERNGLVKASDVIVTGRLTRAALNAVSTCFSRLESRLGEADERAERAAAWLPYSDASYYQLGLAAWTRVLGRRQNDYGYCEKDRDAFQRCILNRKTPWYRVFDLIEFAIEWMEIDYEDEDRIAAKDMFVQDLNESFRRVNLGYRVMAGRIVDVVSEVEIESLEETAGTGPDLVVPHFRQAMALYAQRPDPDYRNAIKEAITAVETLLRSVTGETTFGKAFYRAKSEFDVHPRIMEMIQKLYDYTNQPDTGIRHSRMVEDPTFLPDAEDCRFMLITCSAVINYLKSKVADKN